MPESFAYRVRCALEPIEVVHGLLGGQNIHKTFSKNVEFVGQIDVAVQGRGIELRQDEDALDVGVEAVGDGHVDQPVFAGDGDGGFRPIFGQRVEALSDTAAQDHS